MAKVIILRGVSGSGKSTYATSILEQRAACRPVQGGRIFSSDDFWTQHGSKYIENFDVKRLGYAHSWNLRRFIDYLTHLERTPGHNCTTIIIDNTNTTVAEIAPYYAVAQAFGWEAEIVSLDVSPALAHSRNTHGVPKNAHDAQVERFYATNEALPPYWKHTIIKGT